MPIICLPDSADLGQLRTQAREQQRAVRAGDAAAIALAAEFDAPATGTLAAAQLVVARRHGFASWPALVRHLGVVDEYLRRPEQVGPSSDPATEFLRRASLTWSDADGPLQRSAGEVLAAHPDLPLANPWVAAACAEVDALARLLAEDPAAAVRPGGPHRWTPLAYLAFARRAPAPRTDAVVATARLLLNRGADPDTGYLWHGLPTPFTLLTGAFGGGEGGQPPHPAGNALARLLLEAGADPNDGQALYNRMFSPADDHLELLFAFGLGTGDGGPWKRRLGHRADTPAQMLGQQLAWAVTHGFTARVTLLADHGVDLVAPLDSWGIRGTPYEAALTSGHPDVARLLADRGAATPLTEEQQVVAAVLAGDAAAVDRLGPDALARARTDRPGLVVWAATRGAAAVRLAVALGWDVSVRARTDGPSDQPWETALHHAAGTGDVELARLLLELGADPDVRDARFDGTPLNWAEHFGQAVVADLLRGEVGSRSTPP